MKKIFAPFFLSFLILLSLPVVGKAEVLSANSNAQISLQQELDENLSEVANYLNDNTANLKVGEVKKHNIITSNGGTIEVILSLEEKESDNMSLNSVSESGYHDVVAGHTYTFTYTVANLIVGSGSFTAKVDFEVLGTNPMATFDSQSLSLNAQPIQGFNVYDKDIYLTVDTKYVIHAEGYVTFQSSTSLNAFVNVYPWIIITQAGTEGDKPTQALISCGFRIT